MNLPPILTLPRHSKIAPLTKEPSLHSGTRFVFILGMHRSGTSCLTGALETCGLILGDVNKGNRDNLRGSKENKEIRKLNERILMDNNARWYHPPKSMVIMEEHRNSIRKCLARFSSHRTAGIKDPRIVLLADAWLSLAQSFLLVGTFRHPVAVAASLQKRNSIPIEQGFRLWNQYNQALLELHKAYKFPLVEYDLNKYNEYCEKVANLAAAIGLTRNLKGIKQFVSSDLQHAESSSNSIPAKCRKIYRTLKRLDETAPGG